MNLYACLTRHDNYDKTGKLHHQEVYISRTQFLIYPGNRLYVVANNKLGCKCQTGLKICVSCWHKMAVITTPADCQEKQSGSEASDRTTQTLQSSHWQLTTSTIHMTVFYSYTFIYMFSHVCGAHWACINTIHNWCTGDWQQFTFLHLPLCAGML